MVAIPVIENVYIVGRTYSLEERTALFEGIKNGSLAITDITVQPLLGFLEAQGFSEDDNEGR